MRLWYLWQIGKVRKVLVGSPKSTWKEWAFRHRDGADLLVADPADPTYGAPARLAIQRGETSLFRRFFGSLNPYRHPFRYLAVLSELLESQTDDSFVQFFPFRPHPANLELLHRAVRMCDPEEVVVDRLLDCAALDFGRPTSLVDLESSSTSAVQSATRRAQWSKFISSCEEHEVPFSIVRVQGSRLGSGRALGSLERSQSGLGEALHVEVCGSTVFVVADQPIGDESIAAALDYTHAHSAQFASPSQYENLLCAMIDGTGRELGMGIIRSADFRQGLLRIQAACVAPAPVESIELGLLYVRADGLESGEAKLWEI